MMLTRDHRNRINPWKGPSLCSFLFPNVVWILSFLDKVTSDKGQFVTDEWRWRHYIGLHDNTCYVCCDWLWWSKSKPGEKFQYGGPLFFQTGSSYISVLAQYNKGYPLLYCGLRLSHPDEIWFVDIIWPSETRNSIALTIFKMAVAAAQYYFGFWIE